MTVETFEWVGPYDRRLALGSAGLLHDLNRAGVLTAADVHVARSLARVAHEQDEAAVLAAALATRAVRLGSVAVDLAEVPDALGEVTVPDEGDGSGDVVVAWPDPTTWTERVAASHLTTQGALVVEHGLVYLQRYHHQEVQVVRDLQARADQSAPVVDQDVLEAGLVHVFPGDGYAEQRAAAAVAVRSWTTVLTGGPGTGKTTTVAGVLALLAGQAAAVGAPPLRVGLAAPTGKAAARIQEAVRQAFEEIEQRAVDDGTRGLIAQLGDVPAVTLHRLLGRRPDSSTRFRHDRTHRLPHDVVLVDEASMVSLTHMARLLEALRPTTRLILVGDPDQLVSVDAGAVLADLVAGAEAL
ncbi:MAG TPA: AAA family ATPase, partial [Segeticoccus sp.]|uniref:AAA family ATPase n=1 Tax=Segeticoccus sp. TaxID=2706531 RepID=UPI002D7E1D0C